MGNIGLLSTQWRIIAETIKSPYKIEGLVVSDGCIVFLGMEIIEFINRFITKFAWTLGSMTIFVETSTSKTTCMTTLSPTLYWELKKVIRRHRFTVRWRGVGLVRNTF